MTVFDLRVENRPHPLGLGDFRPRFSWKVADTEPNTRQRTRRIQVSATADFAKPLWDSRVVADGESHLVPYRGPALLPQTRYWFRVRVSGTGRQASEWSQPDWFETALAPGTWPAAWISPEAPDERNHRVKVLRHEFQVPFSPLSARLYATAQGLYSATLNGRPVTPAVLTPGRSAPQRVRYQTYDVSELVRSGPNALDAVLAPGWFRSGMADDELGSDRPRLGFSAFLEVRGTGGLVLRIGTDETWRAAFSPWTEADMTQGETYDARHEAPSRWTAASVLTAAPVPVADEGPLLTRGPGIAVHQVATIDDAVIVDFGQTVTGWVSLTVAGTAGQKVVLKYAEALDAKGRFPTKGHHGRPHVDYFLKGGDLETFEPRFSVQTFRFVKVEKWPGPFEATALQAIPVAPEGEAAFEFGCSDPDVNQLHTQVSSAWASQAVALPPAAVPPEWFTPAALRLSAEGLVRRWLAEGADEGVGPWIPWALWEATGDRRLLKDAWPGLRAWAKSPDTRGSDAPDGTPAALLALAREAEGLGRIARAARVLGKPRSAQVLRQRYWRTVQAFREEYLTPSGRLAVATPTAAALALVGGLVSEEHRDRVAADLAQLVQRPWTLDAQGAWAVRQALTQAGRAETAFGLGPGDPHGLVAEWFYRTLGGLRPDPDAAGLQSLVVQPEPGSFTWARSRWQTPYGTVSLVWTKDESAWTLDLEVPPNAQAVLVLPEGRTLYGSGRWAVTVPQTNLDTVPEVTVK